MPKLMYIGTSYNKWMSATTTVQCAAVCKWLQPVSGLVDAFLTGLVDACVHLPRDAHTLGESSCRELQRTPGDVHPFSKATKRKTNQPGKKRSRSMILTDTHGMNAFEAEAAKVKRTTGCTVARTFFPRKEVKSAKRHKDTEEETCQCYSFWRTVWQQQAGWEVGELHRLWQVGPRRLHKRGSMLEVYICHNCESN